jgi:hypothetical protein
LASSQLGNRLRHRIFELILFEANERVLLVIVVLRTKCGKKRTANFATTNGGDHVDDGSAVAKADGGEVRLKLDGLGARRRVH